MPLVFRFASLLCAALLLAPAVQADQLQDIRAKKSITCGTFASIEPFGFPDPKTRQTVGYDVDLCAAVAKEMNVQLVQKPLALEARLPELTLGRVDILIANLAYTKTRAQQIDFSDAYHVLSEVVLVGKGAGITQLDQLAGKKISGTKGSTSELAVRMRIPTAQVMTFQDASAAFLALQQGKAEGFTINDVSASKFVRQTAATATPLVIVPEPTILEPMGVGVRKNEPALLAEINRVLAALEKSGELNRIWDKWLGEKTDYNLKRTHQVTALKDLKFDPLP
ncbi:ABC transporter substrate-binding protein [Pseudorhodoferax sp. LjRoot39]|uniref:ABC transporter substrate-binding protein n=1 Tax=Pseudorhodoferax sp. LjRoot39 TaxID=3342328 RepID=UPI003ECF59FC